MTKLIWSSAICTALVVFLILCLTTTTDIKTARVAGDVVILRQTPSTAGAAEAEVPAGTVVKILDEKVPWYVVRVGDRVGWLHRASLIFSDEPAPNATSEPEPVRVETPPQTSTPPPPTTPSAGRTYIRGPRGGCYYISSSGNKVYVDRSMCN